MSLFHEVRRVEELLKLEKVHLEKIEALLKENWTPELNDEWWKSYEKRNALLDEYKVVCDWYINQLKRKIR